MSAANPFAVAVDALQETADRLSTRVLYGEPALASRLDDVRAALAVFDRLAALANRVERNVLEGEVEHRLPNSVGGIVSAVKWTNDEADEICLPDELFGTWIVETESFHYCTPDFAEEDTVLRLLSVLECRRRNVRVSVERSA